MTEVVEMINDLIRAMREAGVAVPDGVAMEVETKMRQAYGGERLYIARLPKQNRAVQLAKLERHTQVEMALATGLTVRQVRRIRNGK
ncbi:MAG TPA: hypothetical protein DCK83_00375 [Gallionellaceae bacterium]|nr:hypothetical protein [Gallionellaceae bacterium]